MRHRAATVVAAALAGLVAACGPEPGAPRVAVLEFGPDSGRYRLAPVTLETIVDLHRLEGDAAELRGGGYIHIDPAELAVADMQGRLESLEDIRRVFTKDEGAPPVAAFTPGVLDGVEVLVPDDFHTLAMVTTYHHLERARLEGLELGMPGSCLVGMRTYYDLKLIEAQYSPQPLTDNAAFSSLLQAFMVLPFGIFEEVPMAMNPGIMGHEYGHGIWSCVVEDSEPVGLTAALDEVSQNYARGLDEGLADFFGAQVAGAPDYFTKSIPSVSGARDLSVMRTYSSAMEDDAVDGGGYDPYRLGAVLASALWAVHEESGRDGRVGRVALRAMELLRDRLLRCVSRGSTFHVRDFLADLVQATGEVAPQLRGRMCVVLDERFSVVGGAPGC